jgi:hypothetical protein
MAWVKDPGIKETFEGGDPDSKRLSCVRNIFSSDTTLHKTSRKPGLHNYHENLWLSISRILQHITIQSQALQDIRN